ncbi:MAG TPA: FAD-dependent monooxygenase [Vicinamibacterales bacterium]|nr:FAD-dependent monooxygenase [Vicinamibacterales bacterium]
MPDVLIAGAGPAGAIAALVLARAGARVTLFDRARFPRDKLCGDTINPGALAILRRLGVADVASGGLAVEGMLVTGEGGVRCEARYGDGLVGRALRRCALDVALLTAARRAGAIVEEGVLVRGPLMDGDGVHGLAVSSPQCRQHQVTAPIVIAADGGGSRLARALRLSAHARRPRRWAVGAYFSDVDHEGTGCLGEMHIRRGRYIGVAPLPGGFTNACVVTADRRALRDPSSLLLDALQREPTLAPRFAAARPLNRPICLGPLAVTSRAVGAPGLLLAGDAAGFVDPMTGDGLRFAFRGGELAAEVALWALEHGRAGMEQRLSLLRRREFTAKWRFDRALRALVASPAAVRLAGTGARLAPAILARMIRYAGDVAPAAS